MKKFLLAAVLALWGTAAIAASTINPNIPAQNAPLNSAPMRNNFAAANTDINNLLTMFMGTTAPVQPSIGQYWLDTSVTPNIIRNWDSAQWVPAFIYNRSAHTFSPYLSTGSVVATLPLTATTLLGVTTIALNFNTSLVNTAGNLGINLAHSNLFTATQAVSLNAGSLQTALAGTVARLANVDGTITRLELDSYAAASVFSCVRANTTAAAPSALLSGDEICSLNSWGYDGTSLSATGQAAVRTYAAQNWAVGAHGTYLRLATTTNGATTLTDRFSIENDGGFITPSVTGGSKGVGTANISNLYYVSGNATAASASLPLVLNATTGVMTCPTCATSTLNAAALTKTDDTNVTLTLGGTPATALLNAASITVGWSGTLAAGRLNANVVQSFVNDTNVTATISAQVATLAWSGTLAVPRGGIGVGTLASNGVLYGNGAGAVQSLAVNASATAAFLSQSSSGAPSWISSSGTGNVARVAAPTIDSPTFTTAITATGLVKVTDLASQGANTFLANVTSGGASPTAASLPSCTGAAAALQYTSGTGLSCGTITAAASSIIYGTTTAGAAVGIPYNTTNGGTLSALTPVSGGVLYGASATTPAFSALLTQYGPVYGGGAGAAPVSMAAGTDGQLIVGQTSAAPLWKTASGDLTISAAGAFTLAATNTHLTTLANLTTSGALAAGSIASGFGTILTTNTIGTAANTITSASATALTVGLNGATNPALQIDASTASSATGIKIKSAAAAAGVAFSVITSGTNENLKIDAAGSGTIGIGTVSTGAITLGTAVTGSSTINAVTGFQINGAAASGNYQRGNGTNFVSSAIIAGDMPLVTNASGGTPSTTRGAVLCDGVTINCASGTITAVGAAATSIDANGATSVSNGTNNALLYQNTGNVGKLAIVNGGLLNYSSGGVPSNTVTPTLGVAGTSAGSIAFANVTSGTVTLTTVTGALGSVTARLPAVTGTLLSTGGATVDASPGDPTATSSTTAVQMGLGGTCKLTPLVSTRLHIVFTGNSYNLTNADGTSVIGTYGTGAAPGNGAAGTGTTFGNLAYNVNGSAVLEQTFSVSAVVSGLTVGTAYWLDLRAAAVTGGTSQITGVHCMAFEM